ncbi:MAG TPA: quercetin 2,3-dioxygenase [Planctomycetaceae bacterium]|nr:quercetin 2,3-dioxygenase [Planctomycetaceae bacterium]
MLTLRRADERGHADHGWLNSYHTFSFAGYRDPKHMGFRSLRVMNEDRVAAGQGFGTHAHNDMEIVSYVLAGELEHKDSMGNGEVLRPGEFQRITAGTGITHSEFNPSSAEPTHFYQIWLLPERKGIKPSYQQRAFEPAGRKNRFQLVASRDAAEGSLLIHQDANIYLADLDAGMDLKYDIPDGRYVWLQVLRGEVMVNELTANAVSLKTSDAVAVSDESSLTLQATTDAELMLFDLA